MRIPISLKLIIYFLIISILSIFITGKFSFLRTEEALINRTCDQLISVRTEKEKRLQNFFQERVNDINNISKLEDIQNLIKNTEFFNNAKNSSKNSDYIFGYLEARKHYLKLTIIDTSFKTLIYDVPEKKILNRSEKEDFNLYTSICNKLPDNEQVIADEYYTRNSYFLYIARKLKVADKFALLMFEISFEAIDEIMFDNNIYNGLGKTGEVYPVGKDFLMRSSSRFIENSKFRTLVNTEGVQEALLNRPSEKLIKDYRGVEVYSAFKKNNFFGLEWVILAEIDKAEAIKPIEDLENNIIYLSIIISLALAGLVAAISTNITSPIIKLKQETEKIYAGEYGRIIDLKYNNEIGDLIKTFNLMSVQLKDQSEKLEYQQVMRITSMLDGQESERQRLSRELHDGLAQQILAIKLKLEHALSLQGNEREKLLNETQALFSESIKEIRNISNNLMPGILNNYGLFNAIRELARTVNNDTSVKFDYFFSGNEIGLGKKTEIFIYRIIQEALNNTLKHSKADKFSLKIYSDKNIFIEIEDNGVGCDISNKTFRTGNGLSNIKDRVSLLSGKISFLSIPDNGFKIDISIPI